MVAVRETDWEDRLWMLTHEIVVAKTVSGVPAVIETKELVADAIVLASTTVAAFRAVVERATDDDVMEL